MSGAALPTFDPGFTTAAMTEVFSAAARVRTMCRVEAALAEATADAGLIPAEVVADIVGACDSDLDDPGSVLAGGWEAGSPVIVLLERLRAGLSAEAAAALHHGATSQDIIDTALMIQVRQGLEVLAADMRRIVAILEPLARAHRATPQMGRSFLQQGVATTFGLRVALWMDPFVGHLVAAAEIRRRLPLQLGGPVGDTAPWGDAAAAVAAGLAARLELAVPRAPWHTDRSGVAEIVALVGRVAASAGKLALDLAVLSQSEVAEVRIRPGVSSAMAGKRNPIDAMRAVAAAHACTGAAQLVTAAPPLALERGIGSWHTEWLAVPLAFHTAAAAVEAVRDAVTTLEVDAARMAANADGELDPRVVESAGILVDRVLAAAAAVSDPPQGGSAAGG